MGSANFLGLQPITSLSHQFHRQSCRPLLSILSYLAEHRLGMKAVEREVLVEELDQFVEAGACGTAAVISPIGGIQIADKLHVFHSETEVGPVTRKLYDELTGIQFGDIEAPEGWIVEVD